MLRNDEVRKSFTEILQMLRNDEVRKSFTEILQMLRNDEKFPKILFEKIRSNESKPKFLSNLQKFVSSSETPI